MVKRIVLYACIALITFLLGMFAVKFVRHQPQESPWQVLLTFQDRDLNQLSESQGHILQRSIDAILGPQDPNERPFFPRVFRTMSNTSGETRYILVREQPLMEIPGEPRIRTYVFDSTGKLLTRDEFSGGWRTHVTGVHVASNILLHQDALVVDGKYWTGAHSTHHYYVLVGDRVVPAYFDRDGELKRDEYLWTNASIAPSIQ